VNETFKQRRLRIGALTLIVAGLFVLAAFRLAVIVLVDGPRLVSLGRSEHSAEMDLAAVRGPIFDRSGKPLALSAETRSIYARPRSLLASSSSLDQARLAEAVGLTAGELHLRLGRAAPFVWLARHLAPARARAVERLGLEGLGVVNEYKRFYPESNLAAAVVGMAGTDGQGLSGVELQYDKLIRGEPLQLHFYHDALGRPILDSPLELTNPEPGARLELTIDSSIQADAENYLAEQVVRSGASRAAAVVLDPFTGEVLALANVGADPAGTSDRLHNTTVQDVFEPGSTMKGLLGAIALEDGVLDTSRTIYCEQGEWQIAGTTIHDDGRYGSLTLGGIIEVSSNIGAAKIALALGRRRFYKGVAAFGLGRKTGIDLPGEAKGLLPPLASWREVELADHGFGQGVAVTPIQLVTAYAAIANGGAVMRPYVVKAAYDVNGQQVLVHTPQALRRAVSPAVAHKMNQLLRGVVNGRDGTAHLAQVADLTVAGKTGTAQMVDPVTGKYYRNRLVASFVGFLPADDPRLVILVVLYDVPRGHFGGLVAAPVFSKIASDAVQLLSVTPAHPVVEAAGLFPSASSLPDLIGPSRNSDSGDSLNRAAEGEGEHSALRYAPLDPVDNSSEAGRHVPDFRGLSLRSALALARVHKLALEVSGDGYVMRQEPAPDAMLARWGAMPGPSAGEQPRGAVRILLTSDVASGGQAGPPARHAASRVKDRLARRLRSRR
jgi:cell division protein FtsI (penicillin-binding protein 3)